MSSHPHFDDGNAVTWFTDYEAALTAARAANKRVFIDIGREACSSCRALVQSTIPRPEVRALLESSFICVADDADRMTPAIRALGAKHLANARVLPFI
jgi:uncharacterized protein YyaL (SSP411 family)